MLTLNFYSSLLLHINPDDLIFGIFCVGAIIIVPVVLVAAIIVNTNNRNKETIRSRETARSAYYRSLDRLKRDPANPSIKMETIRLGRRYSSVMRDSAGRTIFDEVAIANDINAACTMALPPQNPPLPRPPVPAQPKSIEERLRRLADLKAAGLIDDAEYTFAKASIIDEI